MRARFARRSRRLALGGLLMLLAPVGIAHLAENSVPMTRAGVSQQVVTVPTGLTILSGKVNVAHDGEFQFQTLKARLAFDGGPVSNETLDFYIGSTKVCSAVTQGSGKAICSSDRAYRTSEFAGLGSDPLAYPYKVVFAGDGSLQASTAVGSVEKETGSV